MHKGNYLGLMELIAKFYPLLAHHIGENANGERGHTSYLSKIICEEFIAIMAKEEHAKIMQEIKAARYFSASVDSTPDIAHVDQLTIAVRDISSSCHESVERFLTFLPIYSHTGENLADTLLKYLHTCGLDMA